MWSAKSLRNSEILTTFFYGLRSLFGHQIAVKTFSGPNNFLSAVSGILLELVEYPWSTGRSKNGLFNSTKVYALFLQ